MWLRILVGVAALAAWAALSGNADTKKLTEERRRELIRGLTAEWATAKVVLPMSKKPLPLDSLGAWDEQAWREANYKNGPAARPGDMVQITKVEVGSDKIKIEINDGSKKGSFWDRVQVGTGTQTVPLTRPKTNAMMGTSMEIKFPGPLGDIDAADVKKILAAVLDFDKRTAIESYLDSLPEPIREAIKAEKAIVGMDREQVLLAMGTPVRKVREVKGDVEYEDWQYGKPPGVMRFVVFAGGKVVEIKEYYAGLGGSIADTGPVQ
jgi:hypothetical protein